MFKHVSIDTESRVWFPVVVWLRRPIGLRRYFGKLASARAGNPLKKRTETMAPEVPLWEQVEPMLRITTQTSPEALTFLVEGKLVGEWAKELARTWEHNASQRSQRSHRASIIDLTETQFIDSEGRQILAKLFREGAFFRTACPMIESIISEVTGRSALGGHGAKAESYGAGVESK